MNHREQCEIVADDSAAKESQWLCQRAHMDYILAANKIRPCHCYPVKVYHNDVTWVCEYLGCSDAVGHGDTPGAAMMAFDNMWLGLKETPDDKQD